MASKIPDTYLWIGLGVCLFAAVRGVSYGLRVVYDLTEVHPQPETEASGSQGTEDDISLPSLQVLATKHTNPEVRKAATALIVERFAASTSAMNLLTQDLRAPHGTRARRSVDRAVSLLDDHGVDAEILRPDPSEHASPPQLEPIEITIPGLPQTDQLRSGPRREAVAPAADATLTTVEELFNMLFSGSDEPDAGANWVVVERDNIGGFLQSRARRRRTRNREAVVVNDGDRPLSQADIIQFAASGRRFGDASAADRADF
ncbi:hypothetical protein K490DRAFT_67519 [Saccharata proteae CBS 121410]|uniref:Uncharacterized protein n=1 Tax=Saccharata proteae CBS 121410 TaxID=1314787 RepID=A0A9P4LX07_9PEZI|nr:hypothetical protein K490DRAFT_67519 [Saccharata proteae CBS 121410]